ncbi:MAG TPA: hypothetical protein VD965_11330 [Burkholderiales bacterium]|nr:hypothetical protein [Burkholderiales bacterium]
MKSFVLIVGLAFAACAWAQEKKPAVKEPAKKAASSKRQQDARHCLEKGSNTEIIKCAEAYL